MMIFVVVVLLAGCSGAPVQEMSDARQAIKAAISVGAQTKSPKSFSKAQKYLLSAKAALEQGHFSRARSNAIRAKHHAIKARQISINYQVNY